MGPTRSNHPTSIPQLRSRSYLQGGWVTHRASTRSLAETAKMVRPMQLRAQSPLRGGASGAQPATGSMKSAFSVSMALECWTHVVCLTPAGATAYIHTRMELQLRMERREDLKSSGGPRGARPSTLAPTAQRGCCWGLVTLWFGPRAVAIKAALAVLFHIVEQLQLTTVAPPRVRVGCHSPMKEKAALQRWVNRMAQRAWAVGGRFASRDVLMEGKTRDCCGRW